MKIKDAAYLGTRVSKETRSRFVKKSKSIDGARVSDVLRELIDAFVEGRITVAPKTITINLLGESK